MDRRQAASREQRPVEVILADDHPLLLRGLRQLFDEDERFLVLATATDGERLLDAVARFGADVVVTGWVMPFLDGAGVLRALRERPGAPRVVVYSGLEDPELPREVRALGGAGFCSKQQPPEALLETVVAVAAGMMVFPYLAGATPEDPFAQLTERETGILHALAAGGTSIQLADRFGISPNTLKFHLKNLYAKLGVGNRTQAVALYLSHAPRR